MEQPAPSSSTLSNAKFRPADKPRLGVTGTAYHQKPGEQPTAVLTRYNRWLEVVEAPYVRPGLIVTSTWTKLDFGWVDSPSMVHLSNDAGRNFVVQPTPGQLAELASKVVEIGNRHGPLVEVRPGEAVALPLVAGVGVYVRCREGQAVCTLTAFPG